MIIWQADFYRRPLQDEAGNPLWELVVCHADPPDSADPLIAAQFCPQPAAKPDWVTAQFQQMTAQLGTPDRIQVFRPQCVSLLQTACAPLHIIVEPSRRTPALHQILQERAALYPTLPHYNQQPYQPTELEKPPPLPLPETLWGDRWQFAAVAAADLAPAFQTRSIPVAEMPPDHLPFALKLPSDLPIPGVVIEAGRRSMQLARWLQEIRPAYITYIPGDPDGLILEAGLIDRWVLATFTDPEVIPAARTFQTRQQAARGLHFLLIQPDNSGMTFSGIWLLRSPAPHPPLT